MKSFKDVELADELHSGLSALKFINPTEIQSAVIPLGMSGKDVMACAETGSGKTGAYGIPLVSRLIEDEEKIALVLAPTRELAQQIAEFLRQLAKDCRTLSVVCLVGGADIRKQLRVLRKNPRIVVATPGRLTDHLKRKSLDLSKAGILVLDEGDRMLDMGFAPQLNEILKFIPKERQTSLFTATLSEKIQKLANQYLYKPQKVIIGSAAKPVATIKQSVVQVGFKEKDNRILDELNERTGSIIVFARTKNRTDRLARHLDGYGFAVDIIHGGRSQGQRNKAIRDFKSGKSRILCATDVAARGIDVPQVEHVINFDLPMMDEDYVHRIGRTARNGAEGEAVSFVTPEEHRTWQVLARKYQIKNVELTGVVREAKKSRGRSNSGSGEHPFQGRGRKSKKFGGKSGGGSFKGGDKSKSKFKSKKWSDDEYSDKPKRKTNSKFGSKSFSRSEDEYAGKPKRKSGGKFGSKPSWSEDGDKPRRKPAGKFGSKSFSRSDDDYGGKPKRKTNAKFGAKKSFSRSEDGDKPRRKSKAKFGEKSSSWSDDDKPKSKSKSKFGSKSEGMFSKAKSSGKKKTTKRGAYKSGGSSQKKRSNNKRRDSFQSAR